MKLFLCQHCQQTLLFENTKCERCGHQLGYLPDQRVLSAVEPGGANWKALASPDQTYRFCANWEHEGCNWMVTPDEHHALCAACRHNRTIPDISNPIYRSRWQKIEAAKRRLIYTLINLSLPLPTAASGDGEPLDFDFLANPSDAPGAPKVMTGHDNGIITLSLVEADDAMREQLRVAMGEPYRTLLGHFRHECGHFYWDKLVRDGGKIDSCRAIFGDRAGGRRPEAHARKDSSDSPVPVGMSTKAVSIVAIFLGRHPSDNQISRLRLLLWTSTGKAEPCCGGRMIVI